MPTTETTAPATSIAPAPTSSAPPSTSAPTTAAPTPTAPARPVGGYVATFDGAPASPAPFTALDWDVFQATNDSGDRWPDPDPMDAGHGHDCAPPPATHHITTWPDSVFTCRDHLMTSINGSVYGAIFLSPPAMVDFSSGSATISFDVSTWRRACGTGSPCGSPPGRTPCRTRSMTPRASLDAASRCFRSLIGPHWLAEVQRDYVSDPAQEHSSSGTWWRPRRPCGHQSP